tara:strand:- start:106 stop:861 length:756 start_codon:yes stop_codon:yes gene_type:complete
MVKKIKSDPVKQFFNQRKKDIKLMGKDQKLKDLTLEWMIKADKYKYTYNFTWMGIPIIKFPADMIIQQEIMWKLKPDLIIETGIAHGGSILFSAAMLAINGNGGEVVGIDNDIRAHNKKLITKHPMYKYITMYEGSSVDSLILNKVKKHTKNKKCIMVILDSNHTHKHVLEELEIYAPLVTQGSYCILPDTFIEFFPKGHYSHNRPWDVGNNPYTAMKEFLGKNKNFRIDKDLSNKAMITETFDGYLKKIK